jgi:hypothetical protein
MDVMWGLWKLTSGAEPPRRTFHKRRFSTGTQRVATQKHNVDRSREYKYGPAENGQADAATR